MILSRALIPHNHTQHIQTHLSTQIIIKHVRAHAVNALFKINLKQQNFIKSIIYAERVYKSNCMLTTIERRPVSKVRNEVIEAVSLLKYSD